MEIIMSIKRDSKTIVKNSVAIPTSAAATVLEVASDVSSIGLDIVRNTVPATKRVGNIIGLFVTGMFNSDLEEKEVQKLYEDTTVRSVFARMEAASLKAGQNLVKGWDDDQPSK
jgi:hypothetical protein